MTVDKDSKVRASDGRVLTLGKRLKSGGAGTIFRMNEAPTLVAKIYHEHVDHAVYERKLEAMLTLPPNLPDILEDGQTEVQIAWPRAVLRDQKGRFLGFAMPLLDLQRSIELEYILQERQARAEGLSAELGAKMSLAANLAALIAELHRQGHYVVDLKPVNLLFYRQSLHVTMLDCDGFSIKGRGERFPAPQYTPEYLAPEFHERGLVSDGEESQDRFALAAVIFQLLNFGIHPFTGRPLSDRVATDIPGRIRERCYAYGMAANRTMAPNPASGHGLMPAELRTLFDRAFAGAGIGRPSANQWAETLRGFALRSNSKLATCSADAKHQHFAGQGCASCARQRLISQTAVQAKAQVKAQAKTRSALSIRFSRSTRPGAGLPVTVTYQRPVGGGWFGWLMAALLVSPFLFLGLAGIQRASSPPPTSTNALPFPGPPRTAASISTVLEVAKTLDKEALIREVSRLNPSPQYHVGPTEKNLRGCEQALAEWRKVSQVAREDLRIERDKVVQKRRLPRQTFPVPERANNNACEVLYYEGSKILDVQAFRHRRADPAMPDETIKAAVQALEQTILNGHEFNTLVWNHLGHAYVVVGDLDRAYAALLTCLLLDRFGIAFAMGSLPSWWLEDWDKDRIRILTARAQVAVAKVMDRLIEAKTQELASRELPTRPPEPAPEIKAPKVKPRRTAKAK